MLLLSSTLLLVGGGELLLMAKGGDGTMIVIASIVKFGVERWKLFGPVEIGISSYVSFFIKFTFYS